MIGILACDHVTDEPLMAAARGRDYHDMYREMLRQHEPTLEYRVFDVVNGELPTDPEECDAWIITGSRHDSYCDEPWIVALRRFVVEAHSVGARLVGVCFGHQVVAHALGGRAGPAGRWRAGPQELRVDTTPWFDGATVWINAMHRDEVLALPSEAVPVATGTTAVYPAYLVGETVFCVQDHPEFDRAYTAALIDSRRDRMGEEVAAEATNTLIRVDTDGDVVGRWIVRFLLDRRR